MDSISRLFKYSQIHKHVQESIEIIEKAFSIYKIEDTCVSFNGGKDCTAVLHLVHSIAKKRSINNNRQQLLAFYAQLPNHFPEESKFVYDTEKRYDLRLLQYSTSSLKESLHKLKSDAPNIEAIFIGTRNDDFRPGTQLRPMAPTDSDWPQFMRINPILNWTYTQVWNFIRELDIPYCDLYNQGYSSLGTRDDTVKNPSLICHNSAGQPYYLPAWRLVSSQEERVSRSASQDMKQLNNNGT